MTLMRIVTAGIALLLASGAAMADRRVALVIGNSAYAHSTPLTSPGNDAGDMAAALKGVGFDVVLGLDLDRRGFDSKLREFARKLSGADTGLFFYAGHGLQVGGQNWLVPVDARLESERDLDFEAVRLDFVMRQMEIERDGKTSLVFLDACRDNPLARNLARSMGTRSSALGSGLAQVQSGVGTFISFSTQPGNVALDGRDRNSPFTGSLARRLAQAGKSLSGVMIDVRNDVITATAGKQVPWDSSALTGDFFFSGSSGAVVPAETTSLQGRVQELEVELKRKGELADTAASLVLQQMKDQKRQAEDAMRQAQMKISQVLGRQSREKDGAAKEQASREVMELHREVARRLTEMRELSGRIEKLEGPK